MRNIKEFTQFFVVSYESVIFLTGMLLTIYLSSSLNEILIKLPNLADPIRYFGALPTAYFVTIVHLFRKSLFPDSDKRKILQQWEDYSKLKTGMIVALLWGVIFTVQGWAAWILSSQGFVGISAFLVLTSLIGGFWNAASVFFAEISINERFALVESEPSEKS